METGVRAVCGFGDSVMKGIVVDRENSPVDGIKYKISDKGFAARCRRNLGIDVENFARFGGMVTHGMKFLNRYADKGKEADYVLFVPCDVTYMPPDVLPRLHQRLARQPQADVAYVMMNGQALYPFCLMKRSSLPTLRAHLAQHQRSLKYCFAEMHAQVAKFKNRALFFHSINSLDELQQYRQLKFL